MSNVVSCWTIDNSPEDRPGRIVVRRFLFIGGIRAPIPTDEFVMCDSVAEARQLVPPGLACYVRDPSDPPSLVETWM